MRCSASAELPAATAGGLAGAAEPGAPAGPDPALLADCVHCGFCLPSCPTYLLFGEEMDSPRGRIDLMAQLVAGTPLTPEVATHFDLCLGCLACMPACPSGVRYDRLLFATRAQVEHRVPRPAGERALRELLFRVVPFPDRLRLALAPARTYQLTGLRALARRSGLLERLPPPVRALDRLLPEGPARRASRPPARTPAVGTRRRVTGMLAGCVQRVVFPEVNAATVRVLAAEGCEVRVPPSQGCCGALSLHEGRDGEARAFAKRLIAAFEAAGVQDVVVNAAGCGSAMKAYGELLADEPAWAERAARFAGRVRDVAELLAELGPVAPRRPLPLVVTYQDACHLRQAQRLHAQPRQLLTGIPELELRELDEPDLCCGSAGIYNLLQPEPARALGERKAERVGRTGAAVVVTGNPGCLLQLRAALPRAGRRVKVAHLVEVLDASIAGTGPGRWLAGDDRPV